VEAAQEAFGEYKIRILDLEEVVTENSKRVFCENVDVLCGLIKLVIRLGALCDFALLFSSMCGNLWSQ
jgi:hypothetical protein